MRLLLLILSAAGLWAAEPVTAVKLDQAGYPPDAPKVAMVVAAQPAREFQLRREPDGKTVFRGTLGEPAEDANSGDRVQIADFSAFRQNGRFYIDVPEVGRSYTFGIKPDVYRRAYYLAMRSFYGQRCGIAVNLGPEFPQYHYPECHKEGGWHASSGKQGPRASNYGWHDAGDYGRYVVNSGLSTGTLLWAQEMFGKRLARIKLDIPETGNGTPDILNEIRWNLEWMLSMQDGDGGVWHKQTSEKFAPFVMPDKDTFISYVIGTGSEPYKNSCATGDFAAVMAIAQRAYAPFDKAFSKRAGDAAANAWTWLDAHPDVLFRNPQPVATGAYGDRDCSDERLWAAAELWRSTGGEAYHDYFLANYQKFLSPIRVPAWPSVGSMGPWAYAMSRRQGANAEAVESIRKATLQAAKEVAGRTETNAYRIAMETRDYIWGGQLLAPAAGGKRAGAQSPLHECRAGQPALSARAQHVLRFLGDVGGDELVQAPTSPPQRRRRNR
jgi:endoglucanase